MPVNEIVGFEHLHLHTEQGSLQDGLSRVEEYAKKWKHHGKYLCITDHGMMSAIPKQIKHCEANGLNSVFGIEMYVNPLQIEYDDDKEFKAYVKSLSPEEQKIMRKSYHLLAIAETEQGYTNLVNLSSLAWTKGFYYKPRVNHEQLMKYKEGIIFTSCCYASEIGQAFDIGGEEAGFAMIEKYMAMLGKNFFLELMLLDFAKQKPYDRFIIKASQKYGLPLEIANDCHYCEKEDSLYQRLLIMSQTKKTVRSLAEKLRDAGDQDFFELQDSNLWMKTEEEINAKWEKDYSDILDYDLFKQAKLNTVEICRRAGNIKLDKTMKFPELPNANEILKDEVVKGFKKRNLPFTKEYQIRIREELELMYEKRFSSYFLVLKKVLDEARRRAKEVLGCSTWVIGPGRGSSCGSFVCYCLGITNVNPIKHGLLFSRFLSKFRKDYPDVDVDIIKDVRDYLKSDWAPKYFGTEYVANIGTYNSYGIKSALLDMARVYEKDRNEVLALTKKLGLKDDDGKTLTWNKALEMYPDLKSYCEKNKEIAAAAEKLVGRNKSMGQHAGGIIISSVPINKYVPLVKKEGEIVTAWTEGLHDQDLGPIGFIKQDWLVINNLEQINRACKLVKERHGISGIYALEGQEDFTDDKFIEDAKAIALANEGDLKGIFQFDSDGIRQLVVKGGVKTFDDLVAYNALFRPGPMELSMHDEYVARKKGEKEYTVHPLLEPILGSTLGVVVFQEQCMRIFNVVGNISLEDCYTLVKAISKKNESYFKKYQEMFLENGIKNLGWTKEQVEELWKQIEAFAGYAFNLSHAVAYVYVAMALLVLKAHYPLEFFASVLHFETDEDKIKEYRIDAENHGIHIKGLDINKSPVKFDIVDNEIYFGFSNVKGIGEAVAERIVENQPYSGFTDFLNRFGTDEGAVKALICLGAFKESYPEKIYRYFQWYKDTKFKREARKVRFENSLERYREQEIELMNQEMPEEEKSASLAEIQTKVARCIENYVKKPTVDSPMMPLEDFIVLPDEKIEIEDKIMALLISAEAAEKQFYGFCWNHPLKKSPDYEGGRTFNVFKEKGLQRGYVEVQIKSASKETSKKNKDFSYWLLKVEDANGEEALVQVWMDDWDRFKNDLVVDALVKLELNAPDPRFGAIRYTLYSPPRWQRERLLPKNRQYDLRVICLRRTEN